MLKNGIPAYLEQFKCQCENPEPLGYGTLNTTGQSWIQKMYQLGMSIDHRITRLEPIGQFCNKCKLAYRYSVVTAVRTCEGCGSIYLPKPEVGTYPIKYFLCTKCDIIPVRKKRV